MVYLQLFLHGSSMGMGPRFLHWFLYGPSMVPLWFLHGSYVAPLWFLVPPSYLVSPLFSVVPPWFPMLPLWCICGSYGSHMIPTWFLHGSYVVPPWLLHGSSVVRLWFVHGSSHAWFLCSSSAVQTGSEPTIFKMLKLTAITNTISCFFPIKFSRVI